MAIKLNTHFKSNRIHSPLLLAHNIRLQMLRLDEIHPAVSGNKWFKLSEYIKHYQNNNYAGILTFGGAFSNHLVATAAACHQLNIPCIGIVRGEEGKHKPSDSLIDCQNWHMELHFVSRAAYKHKNENDFLADIALQYPNYLIVPEGGWGEMGILGASAINEYIAADNDIICLAVGSGTTLTGIVNGAQKHQKVYGFAAIKNGEYLNDVIQKEAQSNNWELATDYHFGGFAKYNTELINFMKSFKEQHGFELDFVYNAKMMFGIFDCISKNNWKNKNVLCIHTGGLQGNRSIQHLLS